MPIKKSEYRKMDIVKVTQLLLEMRENCGQKNGGETYDDPKRMEKYDALTFVLEEICTLPATYGLFEKRPEEIIPNIKVSPLQCKTCGTEFVTISKQSKKSVCCPYCGTKIKSEEWWG